MLHLLGELVQNDSESAVSLLATVVDVANCVDSEDDLQVTASDDTSLTSSTDTLDVHHLSSYMSPAGRSLVFQH